MGKEYAPSASVVNGFRILFAYETAWRKNGMEKCTWARWQPTGKSCPSNRWPFTDSESEMRVNYKMRARAIFAVELSTRQHTSRSFESWEWLGLSTHRIKKSCGRPNAFCRLMSHRYTHIDWLGIDNEIKSWLGCGSRSSIFMGKIDSKAFRNRNVNANNNQAKRISARKPCRTFQLPCTMHSTTTMTLTLTARIQFRIDCCHGWERKSGKNQWICENQIQIAFKPSATLSIRAFYSSIDGPDFPAGQCTAKWEQLCEHF